MASERSHSQAVVYQTTTKVREHEKAQNLGKQDYALRDGRHVSVRSIKPADVDALIDFHRRLSITSIHNRFFCAHPDLCSEEARSFANIDRHRRMALVALNGGAIVGVGRHEGFNDGRSTEIAFVVADDYQGAGLGSIPLRLVAQYAIGEGYSRLVAQMLTANDALREVLVDSGFLSGLHEDAGVTDVELDISALREDKRA